MPLVIQWVQLRLLLMFLLYKQLCKHLHREGRGYPIPGRYKLNGLQEVSCAPLGMLRQHFTQAWHDKIFNKQWMWIVFSSSVYVSSILLIFSSLCLLFSVWSDVFCCLFLPACLCPSVSLFCLSCFSVESVRGRGTKWKESWSIFSRRSGSSFSWMWLWLLSQRLY